MSTGGKDKEMKELTEQECFRFLKTLFPGGLKDAALLAEVCPESWQASPIYLSVNPTLERSYEEYVRMHEKRFYMGTSGKDHQDPTRTRRSPRAGQTPRPTKRSSLHRPGLPIGLRPLPNRLATGGLTQIPT